MKTLNLTLRTILLAIVLAGTATSALAYDFVVKGIYYNINGDEATVTYKRQYKEYTGYNGVYNTYYENDCVGDVSIPETVTYNGDTYTVTAIGEYAFYDRYATTAITGISLPNTITSIGSCAFQGCTGLKSISIPESVTTIASCAFDNCCGLKNANISKSVISIGNFAFRDCAGLTDITIPNSVTTIGQYAFESCI